MSTVATDKGLIYNQSLNTDGKNGTETELWKSWLESKDLVLVSGFLDCDSGLYMDSEPGMRNKSLHDGEERRVGVYREKKRLPS